MRKYIIFIFWVGMLLINTTYAYVMNQSHTNLQEAEFAMGCFWCGATEFADHQSNEKLPGIISVTVGYEGGVIPNPTYENHPGYKEALRVVFDPEKISYAKLLDIFWHNVDPFDADGQFCDKGSAYTAVIFYKNEEQKKLAELSKEQLEKKLNQKVVTQIIPASKFYNAEDYHQDYKRKNPIRYQYYRWSCGRDQRLKQIWKDESIK